MIVVEGEIKTVCEFLGSVTSGQLAAATDPTAMAADGVYRSHPGDVVEELSDRLIDAFTTLRTFYLDVATSSDAVVITRN